MNLESDGEALVPPSFGPSAGSGWPNVGIYNLDEDENGHFGALGGERSVDAFIMCTLTAGAKLSKGEAAKRPPGTPVKRVKMSHIIDRLWQSAVASKIRFPDFDDPHGAGVKAAKKEKLRKSLPAAFPVTMKPARTEHQRRDALNFSSTGLNMEVDADGDDEKASLTMGRDARYEGLGLGRPAVHPMAHPGTDVKGRTSWLMRRSSSGAFSSGSETSTAATPTRLTYKGKNWTSKLPMLSAGSASTSTSTSATESPTADAMTRHLPGVPPKKGTFAIPAQPQSSNPFSPFLRMHCSMAFGEEQLGRLERDFMEIDKLGRGKFGRVKVRCKQGSQKVFAVKKSKLVELIKHMMRSDPAPRIEAGLIAAHPIVIRPRANTTQLCSRTCHNKHKSMYGVASVSSFRTAINSGSVNPFSYFLSRPPSEDMSMSMSMTQFTFPSTSPSQLNCLLFGMSVDPSHLPDATASIDEPSDHESELGSEDELANIMQNMRILVQGPDGTSVEAQAEYIKNLQITLRNSVDALHALHAEVAVLRQNQHCWRRRQDQTDGAPVLECVDQRISRLGKQFGVFYELWINPSVFLKPRPAQQSILECYSNSNAKDRGITLELYEFLPEEFLELLEKQPHFGQKFLSALNHGHAMHLNTLRDKACSVIFNEPAILFKSNTNCTTVPRFQELLGMKLPTNRTPYPTYVHFAPILYEILGDNTTLFRSEFLVKILKVVLFGPSALTNLKAAKPQTNGQLWEVDSVTPGAIAFAAIMARFLISPDHEMSEVGGTSRIPWREDFDEYRALIGTLLEDNNRHMHEMIRFFNRGIFGDTSTDTSARASYDTASRQEFNDILRALREGPNPSEPVAAIVTDHFDQSVKVDIISTGSANALANTDIAAEEVHAVDSEAIAITDGSFNTAIPSSSSHLHKDAPNMMVQQVSTNASNINIPHPRRTARSKSNAVGDGVPHVETSRGRGRGGGRKPSRSGK
ncbi:unnamed protein product [Somion occarium]|uniref:Protein kinase domain-containing protein n=1 Tax=Somion occarium TaxID=3059160 RepID=A0ABP1E9V9_9APHY